MVSSHSRRDAWDRSRGRGISFSPGQVQENDQNRDKEDDRNRPREKSGLLEEDERPAEGPHTQYTQQGGLGSDDVAPPLALRGRDSTRGPRRGISRERAPASR